MPHQCTNCDRVFPNGSKEMLSGCPGCGGNKFQFLPSSAVDDDRLSGGDEGPEADGLQFGHATADSESEPAASIEDRSDGDGIPPTAAGQTEGDDQPTDRDIIDADARATNAREDTAQANARSTVISEDELRSASDDAIEADEPSGGDEDPPDLSALREELNEQFESIKILEPGQYELNLMELYDREEYIVALEEDGRYAIEVPESWRDDEE